MSLDRDSILNTIHRGIKRDIRLLLDNDAWRGAILLTYAGMDALTYLAMPAGQVEATGSDFVRWAEGYIRFDGISQLTGEELWAARCATLHTYGTESRLSRRQAVRQIGYMDKSEPPIRESPEVPGLVLVSVPALAEAFFAGIDHFLISAFADPMKGPLVESRLKTFIHVLPREQQAPS